MILNRIRNTGREGIDERFFRDRAEARLVGYGPPANSDHSGAALRRGPFLLAAGQSSAQHLAGAARGRLCEMDTARKRENGPRSRTVAGCQTYGFGRARRDDEALLDRCRRPGVRVRRPFVAAAGGHAIGIAGFGTLRAAGFDFDLGPLTRPR